MDFDLARALQILSRTPAVVTALLRGLPDAWTRGNEGGDSWSPFDVVGHLVHGERTDWIPRARLILASGESRPFERFDRFAQFRESQGKSIDDLLAEFAAARAANLDTLSGWELEPADLDRRGRHPDLGVVTLRQLLATWVAHDLEHVAQMARVMARRYAEAVGPWREYLPLLSSRGRP